MPPKKILLHIIGILKSPLNYFPFFQAKEIGFCSVSSAPLVPAEGLLDEVLDTTEENDLSSASTLSKVSNTSKLTDIDGKC